jgi:copper chaperone CopZ
MKTSLINVQKEFCTECSLALMHFIGRMKGVESVTAEEGAVVLTFDETEISEEDLVRITRENIEKLGYKITDTQ